MSEEEKFFVSEAIRHARSLPFTDCLQFMRGLTASVATSHPATPLLKTVLAQLTATDAQLELLQVGEIQLQFSDAARPEGAAS